MFHQSFKFCFLLSALSLCITSGCASSKSDMPPTLFASAELPAYSVSIPQPDIIVAVSPVRQTMQIGGSIPTLLGAGISAIQDDRYGKKIHQALEGYDYAGAFENKLRHDLESNIGQKIVRVSPMGTSAGFHSARDAEQARLKALGHKGYDLVLDFDLTYGIYGPEGLLATRITGKLTDLAAGKVLWRNTITNFSMEVYADRRWHDPMERMKPNFFSPRFTTADDAIEKWTANGGEDLRTAYEKSVNDTVAAVLTDMGLEDSAPGHYVLGVQALLNRKQDQAESRFARAYELDPGMVAAANGLAVAKARNKKMDEAIQLLEEHAVKSPDYLPCQYNLAWWLAVEKKNPEKARPYYDTAVRLGASPGRRLEKAMR